MRRVTAIAFAAGMLAGTWSALVLPINRPAAAGDGAVIERVNRQVNALELREPVDWGTGAFAGGCRLYAEEKRRRLIAEGIAPERLALWTVSTRAGLHEVLVVDGDQVLDNLVPDWSQPRRVMERAGYVFIGPASRS